MILPADSVELGEYTPAELHRLKARIEALLPAPQDLDLQAELIAQFQAAKALFAQAQQSTDTPINQLAQVSNSIAALLKQLSDQQIKMQTAERFGAMENALMDLLKEADEEDRNLFLEAFATRLESIA